MLFISTIPFHYLVAFHFMNILILFLFFYLLVDGHLSYLQLLALVNAGAMNIYAHAFCVDELFPLSYSHIP